MLPGYYSLYCPGRGEHVTLCHQCNRSSLLPHCYNNVKNRGVFRHRHIFLCCHVTRCNDPLGLITSGGAPSLSITPATASGDEDPPVAAVLLFFSAHLFPCRGTFTQRFLRTPEKLPPMLIRREAGKALPACPRPSLPPVSTIPCYFLPPAWRWRARSRCRSALSSKREKGALLSRLPLWVRRY
jgi:hypothetical protein